MRITMHIAVFLAIATVSGCGKSSASLDVAVQPEQQTKYGDDAAAVLHLPQDVAFNHATADRHSTALGKADSAAARDGTGSAYVAVSSNGIANAAFQVGHVMYSGKDQPIDAIVAFDCKFAYEVKGPDLVKHSPDVIDLRIVIEDTNQRKLHELVLVGQVDHFGAERREGHEAPSFSVRFEPGTAYILRVTGRLSASAEPDMPPVEARLELTSLSIEIRPKTDAAGSAP
jgi:hypothetical protein